MKSDKAVKMSQFFEGEDWENYRTIVHALKSTSLTIGAVQLSEEAKALEMAAKEENVIFGGRLAEYKYYDMAPVIEHAMAAAEKELKIEILRTRVTKASMIHP